MNILRILCIMLFASLPAKAQQGDVQAVITHQMEAFLKDDFSSAYAFAAPNIKRMFPTVEHFGLMIKNAYPMVHRPYSYQFTETKEAGGAVYQNVLIQDQLGQFFVAEYALVPVGSAWKISSVRIYKRPEAGV